MGMRMGAEILPDAARTARAAAQDDSVSGPIERLVGAADEEALTAFAGVQDDIVTTDNNPGYVVIRQEDAQLFGQQVAQLAAALMALQAEVEKMKRDNAQRVTINHQQAKGLNSRIRDRAEALCAKHGLDAKIHGAAFRSAIKRAVLDDAGVKDFHDLPAAALSAAQARIDTWDSWTLARKRKGMQL